MIFLRRSGFFVAIVAASLLNAYSAHAGKQANSSANPLVRITTTLGTFEVELFADKVPGTVKNFLKYVADGFYDGTIFHRVIPGFMIQGGGMQPGMVRKPTGDPIKNEAANGLKNVTGSLAMARTSDPHSATSQFFINTADNALLDKEQARDGWGYAVFGKVVKGMAVVKKIESVPTGRAGPYADVPKTDIVIEKAELLKPKS